METATRIAGYFFMGIMFITVEKYIVGEQSEGAREP